MTVYAPRWTQIRLTHWPILPVQQLCTDGIKPVLTVLIQENGPTKPPITPGRNHDAPPHHTLPFVSHRVLKS